MSARIASKPKLGRCPRCNRFRVLDRVIEVETVRDDQRRALKAKPRHPTKIVRVCEHCVSHSGAAA